MSDRKIVSKQRRSLMQAIAAGSATTMDRQAPPGQYFVRLFARNACGTSPASNELVVTMP